MVEYVFWTYLKFKTEKFIFFFWFKTENHLFKLSKIALELFIVACEGHLDLEK